MFEWLKKKRLDILEKDIRNYLSIKDEEFLTVKKFSEIGSDRTSHVAYSIKIEPNDEKPDRSGDDSLNHDNYDSDVIREAMQNVSVTASLPYISKVIDETVNESFADRMLDYINKKHLRNSHIYNAAQIDRRLFSKIISDAAYKPSKDTCIALCLAMKLTLSEAGDLLGRAGYMFSHSRKRDVILEYFFREKIYNLNDVNYILYRLDQKTLGR